MSKRTRFSDEFRAKAVALAIAAGYPNTEGALSRVARELGISHQVLRNWVVATQNPPPQDLLQDKKAELRTLIQNEMTTIMRRLPDKRGEATYRELGTVFGIMFDKMQLLDELPTVIIGLSAKLKELAELTDKQGVDLNMLLTNIIAELKVDANAEGDDDES